MGKARCAGSPFSGAAAGIALAADGVQLVLTCLLVSGRGMQGYAFAFTLSAVLGAAINLALHRELSYEELGQFVPNSYN